MNKYDVFNQPYCIGKVEIKNRFTVIPMCEVGDATGAGTIMKAIWDAYEAANSI